MRGTNRGLAKKKNKFKLCLTFFCLQVHRKTLNPVFNETFQFGVPLNELHSRKLHFSVYDFDRFSRHDLIGQVVVDNLLDFSEGSGDKPVWRDIVEGTAVRTALCCRHNPQSNRIQLEKRCLHLIGLE